MNGRLWKLEYSVISPGLPDFLASAKPGHASLVWADLLADVETPLSAYWKLSHDERHSFLLESVTGGEQLARYSFLGVRPKEVLRAKGTEESPLDLLREHLQPSVAVPGMPKFTGGAVGFLGYDFIRYVERLDNPPKDDLQVDDMAMMIADTLVVFDHAKNLIRILVNAEPTEAGYEAACETIWRIAARLKEPLPTLPSGEYPVHPVESNMTQADFEGAVDRIKEYIRAGDCFQLVYSQRFSTQVDAHPLTVYRALRSLNPSPYMFLLRFGDCDVIGASPEILVGLQDGTARVRPIAGTRWRGASPEEDDALAEELLADQKERAEHIMLVDLGRNDLGRVCETGTVKVNDLMVIEKYSHVMHIVSDVTGQLEEGKDALDLIAATFPAGTVSGAPKVRAMEIIDELEPNRRGLYAGAVGYIGNDGNSDLAIAIRTIFMKDGKAYVQAGGGIVYDSVPTNEYQESCNKARACLLAIERAQNVLA